MSTSIVNVNQSQFDAEVLKSSQPVLVDFWAEWCTPCKAIAPILEEVAVDYADRMKVAKLNIDDNREITEQYNIRSIPTLMLFKDGNVVATRVGGGFSKSQLKTFLDAHM